MDQDCLFCKIVSGDNPSTEVFRDDRVMAFLDINPAAPQHILVIPLAHLTFLSTADESHEGLIGHLALTADRIAAERGIQDSGFRLTINQGPDAGQEVDHLHMHITGGRRLGRAGA
ncbi:MAG: histidine triad nucleotide-binding protein [Chloroflexi bacterium]|jgi:histidine triad (HIT) family protein|nr:histidine triad nucleotide-binding protein [Chloroflexota bacterium]MBT4072719.1 histidine triad nucleotide-binding protein [Chloroflexota bacterium]MBT4515471.1 histidine triad nucleotide-binding protein [Chloroflexota bacterium]MBT5318855.1 histidine triad nucleotide-binding protein [Chloroflexota bacterium]MBT6681522.1 histidine triad nucleotide-binding protein [Chloroflexota bacterium]